MALIHAILVALLDCPSSGYDLAKRFDGSVGFFWDASHQQIYRELTKLEVGGHLAGEKIPQEGRPNKVIFSVTESGRLLLEDWMAQPVPLAPVKDALLVKLFGGYIMPTAVILTDLQQHQAQHRERLAEYESIATQFFPNPAVLSARATHQYLTLRHGIQYEQGWLTWCEEAIATLQKL
ncbi:PadR family transcriptional regulator [Leptolyngbya sp. PCC 6406]|uniref:PadR family transcriptional regulator n=1 Tax=Leptolyngbya sp. PCC 6406 TaxID=1173264 RepID=UPI0002AC0F80|nr:PadR family transcriptional regulator [Leptolyngbya sp. PCC 6406]